VCSYIGLSFTNLHLILYSPDIRLAVTELAVSLAAAIVMNNCYCQLAQPNPLVRVRSLTQPAQGSSLCAIVHVPVMLPEHCANVPTMLVTQ